MRWEKLGDLPKIRKLGNDREGIGTQVTSSAISHMDAKKDRASGGALV